MSKEIKNYKNRFFNLLESEMGNVKPLIVESEEDWIEDSEENDLCVQHSLFDLQNRRDVAEQGGY